MMGAIALVTRDRSALLQTPDCVSPNRWAVYAVASREPESAISTKVVSHARRHLGVSQLAARATRGRRNGRTRLLRRMGPDHVPIVASAPSFGAGLREKAQNGKRDMLVRYETLRGLTKQNETENAKGRRTTTPAQPSHDQPGALSAPATPAAVISSAPRRWRC